MLRASYQKTSENFLNPFGGTATPGSRRGEVTVEMKPGKNSTLHFGVTDERNQTANVDNGRLTLSAELHQTLSERVKLFFTQRLASAPIVPIADFTANGLTGSSSSRETAFGVETQLGSRTAMTGRYQLENGINGTDSFAVIGLQHSLPITKQLSAEVGFDDLALEWLDMACEDRDDLLTWGLGIDPRLDGLRSDQRYVQLMKRIGLHDSVD